MAASSGLPRAEAGDLIFFDGFEIRCGPAFTDADGDGFGDPALPSMEELCGPPKGFSFNDLDCDDTSAARAPDQPEICDGLDNNCSSTADEDLQAPLNSVQLGACSGTTQICRGAAGWADDYSEVPLFGLFEEPDGLFADENCDGIDGDLLSAVFVGNGGTDSPECGDQAMPCRSISVGIEQATLASRPHLYVQQGTYPALQVAAEINIYGGYDADWNRPASSPSQIAGESVNGRSRAVELVGVAAKLTDLTLEASNAQPGGIDLNSYGVVVQDSQLVLERVTINQGSGAAGASGSGGQSASQFLASNGGRGQNGLQASLSCSTARSTGGIGGFGGCASTQGGNGGDGGSMDTSCSVFGCEICDALAGDPGAPAPVSGVGFGRGGIGGPTCGPGGGERGEDGRTIHGEPGPGGQGGLAVDGFWESSSGGPGTTGQAGSGGGGGGGSGGCDEGIDDRGPGGGGGGAGGCPAVAPGTGGGGGGASIGVMASNSDVTVRDSVFNRASGGAGGPGGAGGEGQPGGPGGEGGVASEDTVDAGDGGTGGDGGASGGGGGGAGGPSCGIIHDGGTLVEENNVYLGGIGGDGGNGGVGTVSGQAGAGGEICDVLEL